MIFHSLLTLFNISGWAFRKTRRLNLITLGLTAFSWFVLGIWRGWGYCICTDWHWEIRRQLGYTIRDNSYIHFLILHLTGLDMNPRFVDIITLAMFLFSLGMSIWLNLRDYKKKKSIRLMRQ